MKALARAISPRCSNRWKWTRFAVVPWKSKKKLDPFTVRPELVEGLSFSFAEEERTVLRQAQHERSWVKLPANRRSSWTASTTPPIAAAPRIQRWVGPTVD